MYSPIAPISVLEELAAFKLLPNYLLILAHEVVEEPLRWGKLLEKFHGTIILDNSLIELGAPCDPEMLLEAARVTFPSFMVLPDKLLDKDGTLAGTLEAAQTWAQKAPLETGFMVVPQGKDINELLDCAVAYTNAKFNRHIMFGVPRIITNKIPNATRSRVCGMLGAFGKPIHLLGMSENFIDDIRCFRACKQVVGIDSATPVRAGWEESYYSYEHVNGHGIANMKDRNEFFRECRTANSFIRANIQFVNGAIGGARHG